MPTDRVQRPQSQEQTRNLRDAGQAAVPVGGGGAWPGNAQTTSPTDWRPPRGLRGLAGQRTNNEPDRLEVNCLPFLGHRN